MLNDQQQAVIDFVVKNRGLPVPVMVNAGPGSGKTTLLAHLYAALLEVGFLPNEVLAVVYNRSMAQELHERIVRVSGDQTIATTHISTIHAFAVRQYRIAYDYGLTPYPFKLFDQETATARDIVQNRLNIWKPGAHNAFLVWLDASYAAGVSLPEMFTWVSAELEARNTSSIATKANQLVQFRDLFETALKSSRAHTFGKLLYDFECLMDAHPRFLAQMREQFKFVLLDEAQDVGGITYRILERVSRPVDDALPRLMMVGDPDQLLYRFAGAKPENMLNFLQRYPSGRIFKLETNYRSSPTIVAAADEIITPNYNADTDYLRTHMQAAPTALEGEGITYHVARDYFAEAAWVAEQLAAYTGNPGDSVILARTRSRLAYLEHELTQKGVPFINLRGNFFWESRYVKMLLAYLRLLVRPSDNDAFREIYNVASHAMRQPFNHRYNQKGITPINHRYLGAAFLLAVESAAKQHGGVFFNVMDDVSQSNPKFMPGISDFLWLMGELRERWGRYQEDPSGAEPLVVLQWIHELSIKQYIELDDNYKAEADHDPAADIAAAMDIASRFETIGAFLEYVERARSEYENARHNNASGLVILTTVHGYKGLERERVFIVHAHEGSMPHRAAIGMYDYNRGYLPSCIQTIEPDERCIFYVAVTRAKSAVIITHAQEERSGSGQSRKLTPSRYIPKSATAMQTADVYQAIRGLFGGGEDDDSEF